MYKLASSLIVLCAVSTADARPKRNDNDKSKAALQVHVDRAAKAHKAGNFEVALEELQAAYAIDPQPKLLFAMAQVHVKLDNCERAIEHYERFLAAEQDKSKQGIVRQAIDACTKKLADKADKVEKTDGVFRHKKEGEPPARVGVAATTESNVDASIEARPPPVERRPAPPPPAHVEPPPPRPVEPAGAVAATTRSPWYTDALGDALVVAGVGATVGSVLLYRAADRELDEAEAAPSLDGYKDHRERAETKQLYTLVLAGGGIALVATGVLRFALRDGKRETRGVAVVPARGGGLVTWSGGF